MEAVEGRNVSITAGTKFDLPLLVKAPSHVDWSFTFSRESAGTDINFGVQLKGAPSAHGPSDVEVVAPTRLADGAPGLRAVRRRSGGAWRLAATIGRGRLMRGGRRRRILHTGISRRGVINGGRGARGGGRDGGGMHPLGT